MRILFIYLIPWIITTEAAILSDVVSTAYCLAQCTDANCKCVNANNDNIKNIPYLEKKTDANVELQCKDVNRLVLKHDYGIYVIEQSSMIDKVWTSPIISNNTFYEFANLRGGNKYRYRVRQITMQGVASPEITEWFQTNKENYVPMEVKNVTVSQLTANNEKPYSIHAQLNIIPADDLNCLYNVIQWGEEHNLYHYQFDAVRGYQMKIGHLRFNETNTIYVIASNELDSQHSKNVTLTFKTPSCLNVYNDLKICAPETVTGLNIAISASNKNTIIFKVAWNEPKLHPNNYTVIVQPIDDDNKSFEVTVPGNKTMALVPEVSLAHRYKIGVIAESEGGTSFDWKLFTRVDQSNGSQVIVAISILTTLVAFLTIGYTYCRFKLFKNHPSHYSFFKNINQKGCAFEDVTSPLKSTYDTEEKKSGDKFEIPADRLSIKKVLGSGIGGIVKLATLQDDQKKSIQVAVKMLQEDATTEDIKNFNREILLMKSAGNHRNIVSLIGYCTLKNNPLLIVEYCCKGDLQTYLRTIMEEAMNVIFKQIHWPSNSSALQDSQRKFGCAINNQLYNIQPEATFENKLTPEDLLNFARQVANGMEFLSSNRIVHRDLAARNVLLCADNTVKISDFGLSRDIYQENVYKKQSDGKLPLKWMAIEALTHQVYTTQSDVWSFGILLYEIVTLGGNPYPSLQSNQVLHLLKSGYRMERPSNCGIQLYEIMRSCWHENPINRPTFSHLKYQLDSLLSNVAKNEYLNLSELLQPAQYRKTHNVLTLPRII